MSSSEQTPDGGLQPVAFFSHRLSTAETKYSAFGRELLAIYLTIRHFRHMLEGRQFVIFTDHKPLVYAFRARPDRHSPREIRHLDYISQFSTDIRHVKGVDNVVADCLSRPDTSSIFRDTKIDFAKMAADQKEDKDLQELQQSQTSLSFKTFPLISSEGSIICDVSTGKPRPVVPSTHRRAVFNSIHGLSHPGVRATQQLITARFVWHGINRDVRNWARTCLHCQKSKIQRHIHAPLGTFQAPDARFQHVHLDLVGPLQVSNGYRYLLTCIDRYTRWPEAIPITDITSNTVAQAFIERWIAIYGTPTTITTDRGAQFESALFTSLTRLLGCNRIRTTSYHPQANGLVERFHRQLKAALKAHDDSTRWCEYLPIVLLGIRSTTKQDLGHSPAELVFGTTLQLPGQFVSPSCTKDPPDPSSYADRLAQHMTQLSPATTRTSPRSAYVPKDLQTCTHVFVRRDAVRKPLERPYNGPFKVLTRRDKFFTLLVGTRKENVSVDRLKVAYLDEGFTPDHAPTPHPPRKTPDKSPPPRPPPEPQPRVSQPERATDVRTTRSGRHVHWPKRFVQSVRFI